MNQRTTNFDIWSKEGRKEVSEDKSSLESLEKAESHSQSAIIKKMVYGLGKRR